MSFIMLKLMMILFIMMNIALVTLLERKILGYIQVRKGPNKVGYMGLFQPVVDALKLFTKEMRVLFFSNKVIFMLAPVLSLLLMMSYWMLMCLESKDSILGVNFEIVMMMIISSFSVYVIFLSGWASNSKYALLGAYRGVAQVISYEVSFSFIIMSVFMFSMSLQLKNLIEEQNMGSFMILGGSFMMMMWVIIIMAELNRVPFDLSEGESELVSGFNVEYGGVMFAILFMAEYGMFLFMSWMTMVMFMNMMSEFGVMMIMIIMLSIRGTLIRYRYDKLMSLSWKAILPGVMFMFMMYIEFLSF